MTKKELQQALEIARSNKDIPIECLDVFDGFGLKDFQPIITTLDAVAKLIRWQCFYIFGGGMDSEEFNNLSQIARRKFQIVG